MANKLRFTLPILATFILISLITAPAFAGKATSPEIERVNFLYSPDQILIEGTNLSAEPTEPEVWFDNNPLTVTHFTETEIIVDFNYDVDPGMGQLIVSSAVPRTQPAVLMLTIGVEGAPGATGPPGPPGEVTQAQLDVYVSRIRTLEELVDPCNLVPAGPGISWLGCDKSDTNLAGVDLTGAFLTNSLFIRADLTGVNFTDVTATSVAFNEANLTNANFTNANLRSSNLTFAILDNVTWTNADLSYTLFELGYGIGTNLVNANLSGTNMMWCGLYDANLTGADLTGTNLTSAALNRADLTDADLTAATLTGATLTNVIWSNTTCPDGSNSNTNGLGSCTP